MRPDQHLAAVMTAEAAGQQTEFLFFWGHQPPAAMLELAERTDTVRTA
jgi:hypothetical protein